MRPVIDFLVLHATILIAILAILEGALCAHLIRRNEKLQARLHRATEAAEDAARAAALAAPGNIDPEVVIHLLRTGQPTTLDNVNSLMEQKDREEAARMGATPPQVG